MRTYLFAHVVRKETMVTLSPIQLPTELVSGPAKTNVVCPSLRENVPICSMYKH